MTKGFLFLLSFVLTQQILAYPRRHKIAKHIQHETKAKDHPCRQSLEVRDRAFPILAYLQELLIDARKTKQHIACRTDPKSCSDKMLRNAKKRFTTFHVSALCGEEIMYDISLVLEHFYKEFMAINAELEYLYSNLILDANDQLKHLLDGTLNHLRDVVISLKPNGKDPFIATKNFHTVKGKLTEIKFLRKYVKIILDFEHFVKSAVSIIKLK